MIHKKSKFQSPNVQGQKSNDERYESFSTNLFNTILHFCLLQKEKHTYLFISFSGVFMVSFLSVPPR